jgi:hypothetical protein
VDDDRGPRLGEIGLQEFAPYLMNCIMGRHNAALRQDLAKVGLTIPKVPSRAIRSVIDGLLIGQLAEYTVVKQSTLSHAIEALAAKGLLRRVADGKDGRAHAPVDHRCRPPHVRSALADHAAELSAHLREYRCCGTHSLHHHAAANHREYSRK